MKAARCDCWQWRSTTDRSSARSICRTRCGSMKRTRSNGTDYFGFRSRSNNMNNEGPFSLEPAELEMKSGDAASPAIVADMSEQTKAPRIPDELSILPVRGFVVFPGTIVPLNVRRPASIALLDETLPRTKVIGLLTQRDEAKEDPEPNELYHVGTAAQVLKMIRQADDHLLIIAQGLRRFRLRKIVATSPFVRAEIDLLESKSPPESKEWEAEFRNLRDSAAHLFELTPEMPEQARLMVMNISE